MARTTSTRRTSRTSRKKAAPSASPLALDAAGVLTAVFGVVSLVSLAGPGEAGEIGRDIERLLRMMAGAGAYVVPVLCFLLSGLMFFGKLRLHFTTRVVAAICLWLVLLGWLQVAKAPLPISPDSFFSSDVMRLGGGYVGAGTSYFLIEAFGQVSTLWILGALGVISAMYLVDYPLFTRLAETIRASREASLQAKDARVAVNKPVKPTRAELAAEKAAERMARQEEASSSPFRDEPDEKPAQQPALDFDSVIAKAVENRAKAQHEDLAAMAKAATAKTNGNGKKQGESVGGEEDEAGATYDESSYDAPPLSLLLDSPPIPPRSADELKETVSIIERTLQEFNITANVVEIAHGPTVTRYEIQLAPGIRVNKIVSLADNIAMSLAAINVRVEAPIPGKAAIGLEVPNRHRGLVNLKECLLADEVSQHPSRLAFPLGLDVAGRPMVADLCAMPHLLVAGATNMGKSVMLNSLITSILYRATPAEVKLVLIDPKRVELSLFDGIPHLAFPVIRDVKQAAGILKAAVQEMDARYDRLANRGTRNIQGYNEQMSPEDRMHYLVVVVDELADLMMQAGPDVESSICRLAQLARAVGIHLVIATQRPSVDVVTGTIKANIASRIAFAVSSQIDSRTILDQNGAERLIGKGDLLFRPIDAPKPLRAQGAYISEQEIKQVVDHLRSQGKPEYTLSPTEVGGSGGGGEGGEMGDPAFQDEYFEPAVRLVVSTGRASTSMIQRRYRIGYTRAARMVDAMEKIGIVGPPDGANPREVLITPSQIDEFLGLPTGAVGFEQDFDEEDEV